MTIPLINIDVLNTIPLIFIDIVDATMVTHSGSLEEIVVAKALESLLVGG